jgi:DNA-binding NarL/FixJ family response regulator
VDDDVERYAPTGAAETGAATHVVRDRAGAPDTVRVLIVDEHEIVREGLRAVLARRPELRLVGEACSPEGAIDEAARAQPDVVVMDVRPRDAGAFEACRSIREHAPGTKIIILMPEADEHMVTDSILAGASGVILQRIGADALLDAIVSVAHGASLLDPVITSQVLGALRAAGGQREDPAVPLSPQQRRVLMQIGQGKTNREIALAIGLSEKTVKNYVSSILNKLQMHRRSEAAAFVARQAEHDQ